MFYDCFIIYVKMLFRVWRTQECNFLNSLYLQNFASNLRRCIHLQKSIYGRSKAKSLKPPIKRPCFCLVWLCCVLLQHAGSLVEVCGLSCHLAWVLVPQPGIKSVSPAMESRFLTTGEPPRKSQETLLLEQFKSVFHIVHLHKHAISIMIFQKGQILNFVVWVKCWY